MAYWELFLIYIMFSTYCLYFVKKLTSFVSVVICMSVLLGLRKYLIMNHLRKKICLRVKITPNQGQVNMFRRVTLTFQNIFTWQNKKCYNNT